MASTALPPDDLLPDDDRRSLARLRQELLTDALGTLLAERYPDNPVVRQAMQEPSSSEPKAPDARWPERPRRSDWGVG